jgi:uncharacterized membrane protein
MTLERKLKSAINDNRLLMLGAQVLFGFQFDGIFQELFDTLPYLSRVLVCCGLTLLMLSIGLLIAPSMQHRIVEGGQDSPQVLAAATTFAGWALLPLALALAFDMFVAIAHLTETLFGAVVAGGFFLTATICWYALAFAVQRKRLSMRQGTIRPTPLADKVDQLLTEARVIIPGAQALFGFQLSLPLLRSFQELPPEAKMAHVVALCCVGLAVILLMAPASLHRISFAGEDDPAFVKIGSLFVIAAPAPLALGIACETYVAAGRAVESGTVAIALGIAAALVLLSLWYVFPIWRRLKYGPTRP